MRWRPVSRPADGLEVVCGLAGAELGVHLPLPPLQLVLRFVVPDDVSYGQAPWVVADVVCGMVVSAWPRSLGEVCEERMQFDFCVGACLLACLFIGDRQVSPLLCVDVWPWPRCPPPFVLVPLELARTYAEAVFSEVGQVKEIVFVAEERLPKPGDDLADAVEWRWPGAQFGVRVPSKAQCVRSILHALVQFEGDSFDSELDAHCATAPGCPSGIQFQPACCMLSVLCGVLLSGIMRDERQGQELSSSELSSCTRREPAWMEQPSLGGSLVVVAFDSAVPCPPPLGQEGLAPLLRVVHGLLALPAVVTNVILCLQQSRGGLSGDAGALGLGATGQVWPPTCQVLVELPMIIAAP